MAATHRLVRAKAPPSTRRAVHPHRGVARPRGGRWKQLRGKIQETWGDLTGDELDQLAGRRDQLVGRIQEKTGQAENEIRDKIESLEKECSSA